MEPLTGHLGSPESLVSCLMKSSAVGVLSSESETLISVTGDSAFIVGEEFSFVNKEIREASKEHSFIRWLDSDSDN